MEVAENTLSGVQIRKYKLSETTYRRILYALFLVLSLSIFSIPFVYTMNLQSIEISSLNSRLQEQGMVLNNTYDNLNSANSTIQSITQEKVNLNDNLNYTVVTLNETEQQLQYRNLNIIYLSRELNLTRSGSFYKVHDPTYDEMKAFLFEDTTDNNTYSVPFYMCRHFAMDVKNHATAYGIRCGYVEFYGSNKNTPGQPSSEWIGHAMVCFDTVDKGLIYIESQNDNECNISMGNVYWSIVIEDLLVIW